MSKPLTGKKIRECLEFLDLIKQVDSGKIKEKAVFLKTYVGVSNKDAFKIILFWEDHQKKLNL